MSFSPVFSTALRVPRARTRGRGKGVLRPEIVISERPAQAEERGVPGQPWLEPTRRLAHDRRYTCVYRPRTKATAERFIQTLLSSGLRA